MARPKKVGLAYFPIDCQMDDKIDILKAVHGIEGFATYIMLLQEIYQTSDGELDMTIVFRWKTLEKKFILPEGKLQQIVSDMLEINLFNKAYFEATQKLTSNGIKKRLNEVEERRNKDRRRKAPVIQIISEDNPVENPGIPTENTRKITQKEREMENKEINKERKPYSFQILPKSNYWSVLQIPFSRYQSWLKSEAKKVYVQFPEHWTPAMIDLYKTDWLGYRQAKRSRLQAKSIQTQIDQLAPLTIDQLKACINNSISGGYQGIFPEKFLKPNRDVKNQPFFASSTNVTRPLPFRELS